MTLDEAIEHAKEVARTCDDIQCAADHVQLAEWLRRARGAESAARWYTGKIRELEDESDLLRVQNEELEKRCQFLEMKCSLQGKEYSRTRKEYLALFHESNNAATWNLVHNARLSDENAKLRKLLQRWYPHMVKRVSKDALGQWGDLQTLREVGIEVE